MKIKSQKDFFAGLMFLIVGAGLGLLCWQMIKRQRAMILSMTRQERRNPDILKNSRKKRIAAGSGTKVEDLNRLLKQHRQMADMMKAMGGGAKRGPMAQMAQMFGIGGGGMPSQEEIAAMQQQMGGGMGNMPKLPSAPPQGLVGGKPGLPGLGAKLPGLGGFNPFGGKKK